MRKDLLKLVILVLMLVFLVGSVLAYNSTKVPREDTGSTQATTPSLMPAEKELAREIAERELADLLKGKRYAITEIGVSHRGSEKLGAIVLIEFKDFYWMTVDSGDWEHTGWVDGLAADVDLEKGVVRGVTVAPSRYTIGKKVNTTVDQIKDERFKRAAEKALNTKKVKDLIVGRSFRVIPDSIIKHNGSEYTTLFIVVTETGREMRFPAFVKDGEVYLENEVMQNED
jgi:hypothetical protein